MSKKFNHFVGKAGHLAMMGEFLMRGWNVAIPEVDVSDDIFVVQDDDGTLRRVQVKTAWAIMQKRSAGLKAQFSIPNRQLMGASKAIDIHYVFLTRLPEGWSKPVSIKKAELKDYLQIKDHRLDAKRNSTLNFSFSSRGNKVICLRKDFSRFLADYSDFPEIPH